MNAVMDNLKSQIENMTDTIGDLQKTAAIRECKIIDLTTENEELKKQRRELSNLVLKWHKHIDDACDKAGIHRPTELIDKAHSIKHGESSLWEGIEDTREK